MKAVLIVLIAIVIILVVISYVLFKRLRALESGQGKELDNIHAEVSSLKNSIKELKENIHNLNEQVSLIEIVNQPEARISPKEDVPSEQPLRNNPAENYNGLEDDKQFLERFDQFVKDNIHDPDLGNDKMVDGMGISRTALYNRVKHLTGMSLQNYMNKVRMEFAAELLKTTELPLAEVAKMAGFSSSPYFSTAFKTYMGLTPSQYKRNN